MWVSIATMLLLFKLFVKSKYLWVGISKYYGSKNKKKQNLKIKIGIEIKYGTIILRKKMDE